MRGIFPLNYELIMGLIYRQINDKNVYNIHVRSFSGNPLEIAEPDMRGKVKLREIKMRKGKGIRVATRIDKKVYLDLKRMAAIEGRSMSETIAVAVDRFTRPDGGEEGKHREGVREVSR